MYHQRGRRAPRVEEVEDAWDGEFEQDNFMNFNSLFPQSLFDMMSQLNCQHTPSNGSQFTSYSSSTVYSSGSNGRPAVVVEKTRSSRIGPNGVAESQESLRDSRSGVERLTIERKLNDKARKLTKQRNHEGIIETTESLENLDEDEASLFDDEWCRAAQHNLVDPFQFRNDAPSRPALDYRPPGERNSSSNQRNSSRPSSYHRTEPIIEEVRTENERNPSSTSSRRSSSFRR